MLVNNLGATEINAKEYADVSAYRNILDMLNTFDGKLNEWGKALGFESSLVSQLSTGLFPYPKASIGYAVKLVGSKGKNSHLSIKFLTDKVFKESGISTPPVTLKRGGAGHGLPLSPKPDSVNITFDMLQIARQINWELNRVRLPVPHNFRQIADKIQGRTFNAIRLCSIEQRNTENGCYTGILPNKFINLIELMGVYKQLKDSIKTIRVATRKEIDAANLAAKVEEKTLRQESEQLISREKAAANVEIRRLEILAQKKADLEKELAEASTLKDELAKAKGDLLAELEELKQLKATAAPEEIAVIESKENDVAIDLVKLDDIYYQKKDYFDTVKRAAVNVNSDIVVAQKEISQDQKTGNKTLPLILTVAAGLIFL